MDFTIEGIVDAQGNRPIVDMEFRVSSVID